jgi:hypothetical protein
MAVDVRFQFINDDQLPLVVSPATDTGSRTTIDGLAGWYAANMEMLEQKLLVHGGILFRGFPINGAEDFQKFVDNLDGRPMDYVGGTVPRSHIYQNVFNSTELHRLFKIKLHNELAYQPLYPDKICFFCNLPSEKGGQTIIADCRKIYQALPAELVDEFDKRGVRYVRVFQDKRPARELVKRCLAPYQHLTWQDAFKTDEREAAEKRCRELQLDCRWCESGDLEVSNVLPATVQHPSTGERLWFNHVINQHFNVRTYGKVVFLTRWLLYPDKSGLPNQVLFGDGAAIPASLVYRIFDVADRHTVAFDWK